jgi:hypothetical protein
MNEYSNSTNSTQRPARRERLHPARTACERWRRRCWRLLMTGHGARVRPRPGGAHGYRRTGAATASGSTDKLTGADRIHDCGRDRIHDRRHPAPPPAVADHHQSSG